MSTKKNTVLVWHYTTGSRAEKILFCGFIQGATANVPKNENPVVWFSMHQKFEPTALKAKRVDGLLVSMTLREMIEHGQGLIRFGIIPRTLLNGENLRKRACITSDEWLRLKKVGIIRRADPNDWYGSTESIDVSLCVFEVMNAFDKWERIEPSEWLHRQEIVKETVD